MRYCTRCATPLEEQDHDGHSWPTCPRCGFVYYRDPKVAVAVITGKEGKVLLGRRNHDPKNGLWTFPSGYANAGEALEDAAYRETKEETGIEVRLERLLAVYSETGNPVVLVVFTGAIVGGAPTAGPETTEVGFFHPSALPELAFDHDAEIIQAWLAGSVIPINSALSETTR